MVGQLANVDSKIAERVANGLGLHGKINPIATTVKVREDLEASPALSILGKAKETLQGRKIGCLVAEGSDGKVVASLRSAAAKAKADFAVVAPKVGGAVTADGQLLPADFQLAGGSSVLFDAVFVALSIDGTTQLSSEAAAVGWVHDAFAHCKVIGATNDAKPLLDLAGVILDEGVIVGSDTNTFVTIAAKGRIWEREPKVRSIY
jgi:catalase